jgi:hypothetical protein
VAKLAHTDIAYPPDFRRRAIGISLVAAVTLYENARTLQTQFLTIPGIRTLLNQGDPTLGIPPGFWDNIERELVRGVYRELVQMGIRAVEGEDSLRSTFWTEDDPFGHVVIYVGTKVHLRALGLHDHPCVRPHLEQPPA